MIRGAAFTMWCVLACNADRGPKWRPAGSPGPRDGGTLRYAIQDQIRTLDPAIGYDEISLEVLHATLDTLLDYEPSGLGLVPRLADRWEVSPDRSAFAFHLRAGVVYADGTPIVAGDIKYALERALATADSPFAPFLGDVIGAQAVIDHKTADCSGILAIGDRDLVIRLARPYAAFVYLFAMPFTAPERRDRVVTAGDQIRRSPSASGPYQLAEWREGQRLVLERNPRYYDRTRGHLDRIVIHENVPRETQFLMFERGELDIVSQLSGPDYLWITSQPTWQPYVHTRALMNAYGSRMNVRVKPFDDRRVRQALNYAVDKQSIVKLLNGTSVAAHGVLSPGMVGRDATLAPYPHDPIKARALLAEAGYGAGLTLEYVTTSDEEAQKLAASLQADLADVGIRLEISPLSFATYLTAIGKPDGPAFSLASWLGDYPDPSDFFEALFHSRMIADENSNNNAFYANPELDALLDRARVEPDDGARQTMYRRAERILYDDAPWIWGYHQLATEVTQPYVRSFGPHPVWLHDYTSAWLDVAQDGMPIPRE
jgi:oligopeptide transport system substrate-binding protein